MQTGTALAPIKNLRVCSQPTQFFLLQNRFNRLFEPFLDEALPLTNWVPACDIYETDKEIIVKAELPGLKKEDVFVSIENNVLMLRGERKFGDEVSVRTSIASSVHTASSFVASRCPLSSTLQRSC
jgi:HSP20 family molecular chaperone IbpA